MSGEEDRSEPDYGPLKAVEMGADEVDEFLHEEGVGLLSLADGGDAYGVPVSFGWDGESLYFFLFQFGDRSKKLDYAEVTATASFAAYTIETKYKWKSVVANGDLRRVPEADQEAMEEVMYDNAWFPNLFPLNEPRTDLRRMELVVGDLTGQMGHGYEYD